jgi:RNA polymerase sigma factor (sigma-70 family)
MAWPPSSCCNQIDRGCVLGAVQVSVSSELRQAGARDFDVLIGPWIEPGYHLGVTMLQDPHEAWDAVQDAAVKAWRSLDRLRDPGQARAWFLAIVANQCRSTMRRRWWNVVRLGAQGPVAEGPEDSVVQSMAIDRAMRRLSLDDRAILHLHFFLDLPLDEVGRVLGISPGAAKARVYRAAHRLRPELTQEDLR